MKGHLYLMFVLSLAFSGVNSCLDVTYDSTTLEGEHLINGICQDSYFQIEIIPNLELDGTEEEDYTLEIKEQNEDITLFELDSENTSKETKTVYLSSHSNRLIMNATLNALNDTDDEFPFTVHFKEIPFERYPTETITANLTLVSGTMIKTLEANKQITYNLSVASPGDQYYDFSYTPQSSLSGFLAMQNGNGRIILMTSKTTQKLALGTDKEVTIDVVTQNSPRDAANTSYRIQYSIGHNDLTSTTPKPTTTTTPKGIASVRIYILEVNEKTFVNSSMADLQAEISMIGNRTLCNMTYSPIFDCRRSCAMSDDPDRGCVTFDVDVAKTYDCSLTSDSMLESVFEDEIPSWKEKYNLNRIELNDCVTPAQASWIAVAVGVPLAAIAVVIAGLMVMKTLRDKQKKRRSSYSRMRSEQRKSGMSFAQSRNSKGGTMNRNLQFEFVED